MALIYVASVAAPRPVTWNVCIAVCAAGLVASLWRNPEQPVGRFLALAPLPWLGRLTYAIYLIQSIAIRMTETVLAKLHLPLTGLTLFPLAYAASVAGAWVAHITVERPMIRRGKAIAERIQKRRA